MPLTQVPVQIAQAVKQKTADAHAETEAVLVPKLNAIQSIEDYTAILQSFYGFFHPVEQTIQQFITPSILPDITKRRTSDLIVKDLAVLGVDKELTLCTALPQIASVSQAFGALYVLEGSTLGGKVIARMLAKNKAVTIPVDALQFFNGYGEETGPMWTTFVSVLNQQENEEEIVKAANETFYHLKNWMELLPQ